MILRWLGELRVRVCWEGLGFGHLKRVGIGHWDGTGMEDGCLELMVQELAASPFSLFSMLGRIKLSLLTSADVHGALIQQAGVLYYSISGREVVTFVVDLHLQSRIPGF